MNLSLEKLRTKEELIRYFKTLGKKITEEELNALKQSYEQINANNGALSLEQLDSVAGGKGYITIMRKEQFDTIPTKRLMLNNAYNLKIFEQFIPEDEKPPELDKQMELLKKIIFRFHSDTVEPEDLGKVEIRILAKQFPHEEKYESVSISDLYHEYREYYEAFSLLAKHSGKDYFYFVPSTYSYNKSGPEDETAKENAKKFLQSFHENKRDLFDLGQLHTNLLASGKIYYLEDSERLPRAVEGKTNIGDYGFNAYSSEDL